MSKFTLAQERYILRNVWFEDGEMCCNSDLKLCNGNIKTVRANVGEIFGDVGILTGKILSSESANVIIEGKVTSRAIPPLNDKGKFQYD